MHLYRQTEFHDGRVVRIQDSRRRPYLDGQSRSSQRRQYEVPVNVVNDEYELDASFLGTTGPKLHSSWDSMSNIPDDHVKSLGKSSGPRPKRRPVILHAPTPVKGPSKAKVIREKAKITELPSSPPTPLLGRLPTPELSDLDEIPFCDCCIDEQVVKRCASCGSELSQRKS